DWDNQNKDAATTEPGTHPRKRGPGADGPAPAVAADVTAAAHILLIATTQRGPRESAAGRNRRSRLRSRPSGRAATNRRLPPSRGTGPVRFREHSEKVFCKGL